MLGIPDGLGDAVGAAIQATNNLAKSINRLAAAEEERNSSLAKLGEQVAGSYR